eukprot:Trichotokara_eunicae@DN5593_c0_g1_i1.p1
MADRIKSLVDVDNQSLLSVESKILFWALHEKTAILIFHFLVSQLLGLVEELKGFFFTLFSPSPVCLSPACLLDKTTILEDGQQAVFRHPKVSRVQPATFHPLLCPASGRTEQ